MIYWTHLRTHKQTNKQPNERAKKRKKKERTKDWTLSHFKDENTYGSNSVTTERNAFACLGTVFNDYSLRKTAAKSINFFANSWIPVFYHLGNPLFIPVLNEIFPKQLLNYLKLVCRCISMNFLC